MKNPTNIRKLGKSKINSSGLETPVQNSEACACCAVFFSDYAVQELEQHWNNPKGLRSLIKELLEEGFGHFAKPVIWRWHKLVPNSPDYGQLLCQISDQIWVAGACKRIHDFEGKMSDSDIQRAVDHDIAYMQLKWNKSESAKN